ncbi:hypothetical protein vseg_019269 [Gypsophila vaccaria]
METPLSTRRVTRSQTKAVLSTTTVDISSRNIEESQKGNKSAKKSNKRSSLIDITNGSPIVGLATTTKMTKTMTPISSFTPGCGEALLRGQVMNLLHKVDQVADISNFLSFDDTFAGGRHGLKALLNSPAALLAPTPANTPQVLNLNNSEFEALGSVLESPIEDQLTVSKVVNGKTDGLDTESDIISRSLFLNFSETSDSSSTEKSTLKDDEDDDASVWSLQVNASTRDDDEEEEIEDGEVKSNDVQQIDEICEGMKNVRVKDDDEVKLMGKHIRFEYNSDDEVVMEEEVLHLKGIPTHQGKHLRFHDKDDDDE